MVTLIARKEFTYAHRPVRVGETVEVEERHAVALVATKRAVRAGPATAPAPRPRPTPSPPVPAPPVMPPAEDDAPSGDNGDTTEDEAPGRAPADPVEDAGLLRTQRAAAGMRRPPTRRKPVGR